MSFAILILIFFLLYATLSKYDSLLRVIYMTMIVFALTFAISSLLLYNPLLKRAMAEARTCDWTGGTDTSWDTTAN